MSTDFPAWCSDIKTEKWCKDSEVDILESYLLGSITAFEAAENLTEYADRRQTAQSKVGRIWTLLQVCADECADAHDALVELIKSIIATPASKNTGGVNWADQERSFSESWRDSYDSLSGTLLDGTSYQRASNITFPHKWSNFHAFTAIIANSGIFGEDFAMASGMTVIVAALEKQSLSTWEKETNIPAAIQWLLHASKIIFRDGQSLGTDWDGGSDLWHGEAGFSRQRWSFWKERLEQIQSDDALNDDLKELARKAGTAMGKAERAKN